MDGSSASWADAADETLLAAYAAGNATAARVLSDRHVPRILSFASRLLGGDRAEAEDVVQDAMLRLWKIAPEWREGEAKVSTWLFRVTSNLCTDRLRKSGRGVDIAAVPEPEDGAPSAAQKMQQASRLDALQAALTQLPERQRQAVVLRHIEGFSNPEIAEVMDIGVEAVESLTARGKRRLADLLATRKDELGYEDE